MSLFDASLSHSFQKIISATALLSFVFFYRLIISYNRKPKYCTVGTVEADFREVIEKGVVKYPDTPFYIPTQIPVLILPRSALDDIKKLPDSMCDQYKVFKGQFHGKFSRFPESPDLMTSVINSDLRANFQYSLQQVQDELKYSFDREFGTYEDWKSWNIYQNIARIVALTSGRAFVGRPLSRNDEWLDISVKYVLQLAIVKDVLYKWPVWTRDIVGPHLKEIKSLRRFQKRIIELIKPLIDAHLAKGKNEKLRSDCGDEKGNNISWILSRMGPDELQNPEIIHDNILLMTFNSIHAISIAVIQAIFDLASYREYIPILLREFQDVIEKDGYHAPKPGYSPLSKSSLAKLSKLDSFLKESQRMNNLFLISHSRETLVDFKLSNGCLIPKRTRIAIPSWVIHHESTSLFSPGLTKPLSEFDGLRFHNLRRLPGNENRHYFVSTSPDSLAFGHGNHACPGRFFASNDIKVIILELLRNWEFRFPEDENLQGGAWRRPKNIFIQLDCLPDLHARMELRKKRA